MEASSKLAALTALALVGGGATGEAPRHVTPERLADFRGTEAWRLRNETAELVVVPAIGRIAQYNLRGGPNVLWSGRARDGSVWGFGAWPNWGGDKLWVWPQDGWPRRAGQGWPPPGDGAVQHWRCRAESDRLVLTGPVYDGHGCRGVREIALAATGADVTITNRLEPVDDADLAGLGAWTVTQVPALPEVYARLRSNAGGDGVHDPKPGWDAPTRLADILRFQRTGEKAIKSFIDGDALAVRVERTLFAIRTASTSAGEGFRPGESAQVFASPEPDPTRPATCTPYLELELTSPRATAGEQPSLTVVWTLLPLGPDETAPEALAARLQDLPTGR